MRLRRVCSKWKGAAKKTIVPLSDFVIGGLVKYNAMRVMSTALPNLQQIRIQYLGVGRKYSDGEEPDEQEAAETRSFSTHDIGISNFAKLRILTIWQAPLNGRYPVLFNFPLLQKLKIWNCRFLKWDLDMLAGLPVLKELTCVGNELHVTGNLSSLRVLKDTLEMVQISNCDNIDGNFMDLADFPRLNWLNLQGTNVTGDIRDIGENDFTALVTLRLPKCVYGGIGYEFRSIAEASDFFSRIYPRVVKRNEKRFRFCHWKLSKESPDWYIGDHDQIPPPFEFELVIITGSRVGWRWKSTCCYSDNGYDSVEEMTSSCEINWLEPEPDRESSGYEDYTRKLNALQEEIDFYRGYNQPPTEEEYHRLCEESADY